MLPAGGHLACFACHTLPNAFAHGFMLLCRAVAVALVSVAITVAVCGIPRDRLNRMIECLDAFDTGCQCILLCDTLHDTISVLGLSVCVPAMAVFPFGIGYCVGILPGCRSPWLRCLLTGRSVCIVSAWRHVMAALPVGIVSVCIFLLVCLPWLLATQIVGSVFICLPVADFTGSWPAWNPTGIWAVRHCEQWCAAFEFVK